MANRDLPPSLAIGYLDDDPTHGDDPPPEPPSFPYGSDRDPPSYSPSSRCKLSDYSANSYHCRGGFRECSTIFVRIPLFQKTSSAQLAGA